MQYFSAQYVYHRFLLWNYVINGLRYLTGQASSQTAATLQQTARRASTSLVLCIALSSSFLIYLL